MTKREAKKIFGSWLLKRKEIDEYRKQINEVIKLKREGKENEAVKMFKSISEGLMQKSNTKVWEGGITKLTEIRMQIFEREHKNLPQYTGLSFKDMQDQDIRHILFIFYEGQQISQMQCSFSKDEIEKILYDKDYHETRITDPSEKKLLYEILWLLEQDDLYNKGTKEEKATYFYELYNLTSNAFNLVTHTIPIIWESILQKSSAKE
jgi:hypothetical protein